MLDAIRVAFDLGFVAADASPWVVDFDRRGKFGGLAVRVSGVEGCVDDAAPRIHDLDLLSK